MIMELDESRRIPHNYRRSWAESRLADTDFHNIPFIVNILQTDALKLRGFLPKLSRT
jgi:hypothetical protein